MENIFLSLSEKDFEALIRNCVKSELQNLKPIPAQETEYITRQETANILGISLPTLNDWSKRGLIPSYRIATRVRYKKAEIESSLHKMQTFKYGRGF